MFNIFKAHKRNEKLLKENETLLEENKILKAQNEALSQFRKSFESYYNDVSGSKLIVKQNYKTLTLTGVYIIDWENIHYPADEYKRIIADKISYQLIPFIHFDVVDNPVRGVKDMVGRLEIVSG